MLGFPKTSSQSQERIHRWTHCLAALLVDGSLVTEHPGAGRAGRRASVWKPSQSESALWFIVSSSKHGPGCKLRPKENSPKAYDIALMILLLMKCFLETVALQMFASKWFIMLCIFCLQLNTCCQQMLFVGHKRVTMIFFWCYQLTILFLIQSFKVKDKYASGAQFFIFFYMKLMNQKFNYNILLKRMEDEILTKKMNGKVMLF